MSNRYIFTDIDGVLNPKMNRIWDKGCVYWYNKICKDFDLKPILSSSCRVMFSEVQMQKIFIDQGITSKIYGFTPILCDHRGLEIDQWLIENSWDKYVVIDDKIDNIIPYVNNVVRCVGWVGLTELQYNIIKEIMK